jgi:hypothetical protein
MGNDQNAFIRSAVYSLFAAVVATVTKVATKLAAVTVTALPTPLDDIVSRNWNERSPDMHWSTAMFARSAEIFQIPGDVLDSEVIEYVPEYPVSIQNEYCSFQ